MMSIESVSDENFQLGILDEMLYNNLRWLHFVKITLF